MSKKINAIKINNDLVKVVFETLKEVTNNKLSIVSPLSKATEIKTMVNDEDLHKRLGYMVFFLDYIFSDATITLESNLKTFSISYGQSSSTRLSSDDLIETFSLFSLNLFERCQTQGNRYAERILSQL